MVKRGQGSCAEQDETLLSRQSCLFGQSSIIGADPQSDCSTIGARSHTRSGHTHVPYVLGRLVDSPTLCYNSLTPVICSIRRLTHNTPCWTGQRTQTGYISKEEKR
jgi:hypothetical protein